MADDPKTKVDVKAAKKTKLAEALRDNLARRKAVARARDADPEASGLSFRATPIRSERD
jgi:hypothetical protein